MYSVFKIEKMKEFPAVGSYFLLKGGKASAEHKGARVRFLNIVIIDLLDQIILYCVVLSCAL